MPNDFYIVNQKQLNKEFDLMARLFPKAIKNALIAFAMDVVNWVKFKVKSDRHIVTGRLWNSFHWQSREKQGQTSYQWDGGHGSRKLGVAPKVDEVFVGTNVEYADSVERGRRYSSETIVQGVENSDFDKHVEAELRKL